MTADGEALGETFLRVARQLRRETQALVAPLGLNPHQSRALRIVAAHGPLRPSAMAERLAIAPRSVTEVVDSLVGLGLVARAPDPADRRASLLSLTPLGAERAAEIAAIRGGVSASFFGRLSAAERAALAGVLARLDPGPRP